MSNSRLISLEGEDEILYVLPEELEYFSETGNVPLQAYHRNPAIEPELMGGFFSAIVQGIGKAVTAIPRAVRERVKERRASNLTTSNENANRAMEYQKAINTARISADEQKRKSMVMLSLGAAGILALVFIMKRK